MPAPWSCPGRPETSAGYLAIIPEAKRGGKLPGARTVFTHTALLHYVYAVKYSTYMLGFLPPMHHENCGKLAPVPSTSNYHTYQRFGSFPFNSPSKELPLLYAAASPTEQFDTHHTKTDLFPTPWEHKQNLARPTPPHLIHARHNKRASHRSGANALHFTCPGVACQLARFCLWGMLWFPAASEHSPSLINSSIALYSITPALACAGYQPYPKISNRYLPARPIPRISFPALPPPAASSVFATRSSHSCRPSG